MSIFCLRAMRIVTVAAIAILAGCEQKQSTTDGGSGGGESSGASGEPIVLGVAAPFTGNSSAFGEQIKMGVELGQEQINKAGGINGREIKLNMQDDAGKASDAQNVATTLATDPAVLAVIGHFNSSCSLAGKDIYSQAKMVMFSPASTNVTVTQDTDYVFRNIFTDEFQGQSLAIYAVSTLGLKKVAILFDNDDYGNGLKDSFKAKAQSLGAETTEYPYTKDASDFRSQLTTLNAWQPEAILIAGLYTEAANIAKQARELGIKTQFLAGDGVFSDQYITLAGEAAEGTFVTCPFLFDLAGQKGKEFADAFKAKYGKEPDAWAALSYDAFNLITSALKEKGASREAVLEYLKGINSPETAYDGLAGKTYFDAEGDCKKPVQVATVKAGKFVAAEKQLTAAEGGADAAAPAPAAADASATAPASTPANMPTPFVQTPAPADAATTAAQ